MRARYTRVSSPQQTSERQLSLDGSVHFEDVCSGIVPFFDRPAAIDLKGQILERKISEVSLLDIDRLGRDLKDILTTLEWFTKHGINISIDTIGHSIVDGKENAVFKMVVSLLGTVAELERKKILERTKAGIAKAKVEGKYSGRATGTTKTREDYLSKYAGELKIIKRQPNSSLRDLAETTNLSVSTVKKLRDLIK